MRKIWILNIAILLMAGVAVAGEDMMQSETNVKEKTSHSTTMQEGANQAQKEHESTTVEKQREATSDDMNGDEATQETVEMEKKHSKTKTSEDINPSSPGSAQEYRQQSETRHQHSTKEVEKN